MADVDRPSVLTYDAAPKPKSPSRAVVVGYWCGLSISTALHGVALLIATHKGLREAKIGPIADAIVIPAGYLLFEIFLSALFLGFTLWLKTKVVKEVAFSSFSVAILWGILGGLFSPVLLITGADKLPETAMVPLALTLLLWQCAFPVVAACFLCYRTHFRD